MTESVIKPVLSNLNIEPVVPSEMSKPGLITNQIIKEIVNDDLVIANLTGLNPNVMYELSLRHSTGKPVVTLSDKATDLPFDIQNQRNIPYIDSYYYLNTTRKMLKDSIIGLGDTKVDKDNPIYNAVQKIVFDSRQDEKTITEALDQLTSKIDNLAVEKRASEKENISVPKSNYGNLFEENTEKDPFAGVKLSLKEDPFKE
ncbi:hypothetical protein [Liquorilactobacillus satsumensis]|uniref:hypothetical protein n=1 Tax=Liquorilactobacillus satsumensis TaxID=259059 RepID=UPI0039EBE735